MNERKQLWRILETLGVCVIFASLYAIGGSGDFWGGQKWIRRFLAPGLFCIWAFLRSFDWRNLAAMPFMFGALCLPYGSDDFIGKFILRASFGAANGVATSIPNFLNKRFALAIMQIIIVIAASVGAGVWNQFPNAMVEQAVIGFIIIFIPAMSVRKKGE